jgi:pyrroline-5-carboxylate reductase
VGPIDQIDDQNNVQYAFIGAGVMAEVMMSGLLEAGLLAPRQLCASDKSASRRATLEATLGVQTTADNRACAARAPVVVLAVKPQNLAEVLAELAGQLAPETVVLSIVAGARIRALQAGLGHARVARCMPNLPCRIRRGMTVWTLPDPHQDADLDRVRQLLRTMGEEVYVDDEGHIDRATAVSGSGPAIVAEFIKAMCEAAVYVGEPRGVAHDTVLATVIGTAEMIRAAGRDHTHVAQLIDEVTSPGGTTSRALQVLKRGHLAATVTEAIEAAHERTVTLGDALERSLEAQRR